ncbi:MAG: hypothetical protein CMH54_01855 [Myxococcales bacterium]|nr:hypothetical protein [Myxococcales bacterium]
MDTIHQWLGRTIVRNDGSEADIPVRWAVIDPSVEPILADHASSICPEKPIVLVSDQRTERYVPALEEALTSLGCSPVRLCVADQPNGEPPVTDDTTIASVRAELQSLGTGLAVSIGSGTINDITKASADELQIPFFSYGTAASMNGYTSSVVAMYEKGLKITRTVPPALGVYANPNVVAQAPTVLALAGLGDLCSKPFACADAAVAGHLIQQTPWRVPEEMVAVAFEQSLNHAEPIGKGDPDGVSVLLEALWISGLSMTVAGTSAPASGGEHLWSHRLDMARHDADQPPVGYHGVQVGVACGLVGPMFAKLAELDTQAVKTRLAQAPFEPDPSSAEFKDWIASRHADLGTSSRAGVEQQAAAKYDRNRRSHQRDRLVEAWETIVKELQTARDAAVRIQSALQLSTAARTPTDLNLDSDTAEHILEVCRDMRDRHTVLDLAADLLPNPWRIV